LKFYYKKKEDCNRLLKKFVMFMDMISVSVRVTQS